VLLPVIGVRLLTANQASSRRRNDGRREREANGLEQMRVAAILTSNRRECVGHFLAAVVAAEETTPFPSKSRHRIG